MWECGNAGMREFILLRQGFGGQGSPSIPFLILILIVILILIPSRYRSQNPMDQNQHIIRMHRPSKSRSQQAEPLQKDLPISIGTELARTAIQITSFTVFFVTAKKSWASRSPG